jgi:beta-ureidopropionase
MKIALVQQYATDDREVNTLRGIAAAREAARSGAALVVFPELSFVRFFPQNKRSQGTAPPAETIPGPTTDRFARLARELGVVIVINLYEVSGNRFYDASPVIDSDGALVGVTRMVHVFDGPGFHETDYYNPGDHGACVYQTSACRLGVAICYDRHFPEYMRALGLKGAELVVVPQAGAENEWPAGLFEAELQVAAFQNGYFAALANRTGPEEHLRFAGESYVVDPGGTVLGRAPAGRDSILYSEIDLSSIANCAARRHFLRDRRPEAYPL